MSLTADAAEFARRSTPLMLDAWEDAMATLPVEPGSAEDARLAVLQRRENERLMARIGVEWRDSGAVELLRVVQTEGEA